MDDVADIIPSVTAYGRQIATVLHNHSLNVNILPRGFVGLTNLLDASAATLKQLHGLLSPDNSQSEKGHQLLSDEGIKYVQLLTLETATVLTEIEQAVEEACLSRQERRKLQKQKRKTGSRKIDTILDPSRLRLDDKEFLKKAEKTNWAVVIKGSEEHFQRLFDLQLLVLLVFQVGTVAKLSKDV